MQWVFEVVGHADVEVSIGGFAVGFGGGPAERFCDPEDVPEASEKVSVF